MKTYVYSKNRFHFSFNGDIYWLMFEWNPIFSITIGYKEYVG